MTGIPLRRGFSGRVRRGIPTSNPNPGGAHRPTELTSPPPPKSDIVHIISAKMVLFVNLSSLPLPPPPPPPTAAPTAAPEAPPLRHPPNRNHPLSALLATYPFLSSLARSLDHNDLYNLSSACWQFHANLSEYRKTLLSLSLRCGNDKPSADPDGEFDWRRLRGGRRCARDLVRGCLRCGTPVCRVCRSSSSSSSFNLVAY